MNIEGFQISLDRINVYNILNNTLTGNLEIRFTFMGSKRKIISIFFIEKMIIDELNFLIKELLIALKEIDNLIIDLWHESFLPVNHSVLFISFTFLPFSSWVILVDALKAVIFRHFYHLFPVKMLTIVTILLYFAS